MDPVELWAAAELIDTLANEKATMSGKEAYDSLSRALYGNVASRQNKQCIHKWFGEHPVSKLQLKEFLQCCAAVGRNKFGTFPWNLRLQLRARPCILTDYHNRDTLAHVSTFLVMGRMAGLPDLPRLALECIFHYAFVVYVPLQDAVKEAYPQHYNRTEKGLRPIVKFRPNFRLSFRTWPPASKSEVIVVPAPEPEVINQIAMVTALPNAAIPNWQIQRALKAVIFARPEGDVEKEALAKYKTLTADF
jgi:hypothetical protein